MRDRILKMGNGVGHSLARLRRVKRNGTAGMGQRLVDANVGSSVARRDFDEVVGAINGLRGIGVHRRVSCIQEQTDKSQL
jgi:hypothetical protein